jgi:glycosyl transferase family 25
MIFNHYDSVRVISLADRADRRRDMTREMAKVGASFEFFDAFRISGRGSFISAGVFGCYLSHLAVLAEASARNESVLIIEDDCSFVPGILEAPVPDVDLYWAGYDQKFGDPEVIIGAQLIGYSATAARSVTSYLASLLDPQTPADAAASTMADHDPMVRPPFDGALVWFMRAHPEISTAFAQLATQRASRSDITPGRFDRMPVVREIASLARRLR